MASELFIAQTFLFSQALGLSPGARIDSSHGRAMASVGNC